MSLHDLLVGLEILGATALVVSVAVAAFCFIPWRYGYRPALKMREEEQRERQGS